MNIDYKLSPGRKLEKLSFEDDIQKIEPVVSIITPYYNGEKYIEQTANSILNQTFPYFEWIIVDDDSPNKEAKEKLKQIEKMDKRIKVYHKENGGPALARDFGVEKASKTSNYLLFLDADDLICNTYIECAYLTLKTNPKASWTYTDTINFDGQEFLWRQWYSPKKELEDNLLVMTSLIKKEDFLQVKGFDVSGKKIYEDWYLWLKLIKNGKYPVRMSFLGTWYRKKPAEESELSQANAKNRKVALSYVKEVAREITEMKQGIQYPKSDFNWDIICDKFPDDIIIPKTKKDKKINVLMIIPWMVTGGADKFNLDLIKGLNKDEYDFTIVSTEPSNNPWRLQFEEYAKIYELPAFMEQKYWPAFIKYLVESKKIDIILTTNSKFGYAVSPYLKANYPEIPIIDYVHMEEWYNRNGGFSRDSSSIESVIDKTYVCNKNTERILEQHFGRNQKEIETVYIGVDEKKFDPTLYDKKQILEELKIDTNGRKVIGFICRIAEQKRPHLLMRILKELKEKRQDFLVVIAGDGPMLEEIKMEVNKFKLDDYVVFLGNIKETEKIYAICDITLNCSIKEGLALTAYESLSMGVPVISADVGGQRELVTEEVGIIVPCLQKEKDIFDFNYKQEEIQPYVDGIIKILDNLESYKSKCRNKILNGFTIDNMISKMDEILKKTKESPNIEKINAGKELSKYPNLLKELITKNFATFEQEYIWLSRQFNEQNINISYAEDFYKYFDETKTLTYKIKHVIVVILRKLHVYDKIKQIIGKK